MAERIVVHTGFMKTGSTLLQNTVFPHIPGAAVHSYADGAAFPMTCLAMRSAPAFADRTPAIAAIRAMVESSDRPVQLFSWEGLVGGFLSNYREFDTLTRLIAEALPDAHILLVIRRQDTLAESLYRQALQTYHFPSVRRFLNRTGEGFGPFQPFGPANIDVRSLDFLAAVEAYEHRFGAERVHVLAYEWLRQDPDRFWSALSAAIGAPVSPAKAGVAENRGYSVLAARIARVINRFYRTPQNPGGWLPLKPFDPRRLLQQGLDRLIYVRGDLIPPAWRTAILAVHAERNRRLDELRNLGLKALGYY